ncbi:MAG: hypothetical protein U0L35_01325, partial [Methanobrevibacter sp.]|nr:hypothetical protein [Methanobrevibacter sp.]
MNFKKAFVFVLLAFLLMNAANATEDTSSSDDAGIIVQQSFYESNMSNGLDNEKGMLNNLDNSNYILNDLDNERDMSNAGNDMMDALNDDALNSETEDIGEGSNSRDDINISFSEQMYEKELEDIDVELGDDISGELCIKIDEEIIYNETITDSHFKVPIVLPKKNYELVINIWPGIDCRTYAVHAFLNGEDLKLNKTLKIMKLPPDYSYLHFQEEVLTSNNRQVFVFPRSANGIVEIWLDDVLLNKTKAQP